MSEKTKKAKGPFRIEAIIPSTIIIVLTALYFSFFFDQHLRKGLEWSASQIHGAEVNVGSLKSSLLGASLTIGAIQVTDRDENTRNSVQIERIHLKFLWDALLRAKFVTEDAEIKNIQLRVPRKSPGKVFEKSESHVVKNIENNLKAQIDDKTQNNVLGDINKLISGAKPKDQIKIIQSELKSDQKIKQIENELKVKEQAWKAKLKELPQKEFLADLKKRAKAIEKTNTKDKKAVLRSLKDLNKLIKESDSAVRKYKTTSKGIQSEISDLKNSYKEVEALAAQDLKSLQSRMSLPDLDSSSLTQSLFATSFSKELAQVQKYMELGRQYIPKKTAQKEQDTLIIPRKRQEGQNIKFPITTGYPRFWLKRALISSEPTDSAFSGKLSGELKNVTDSPSSIKDPLTLEVAGDFPKIQFMGVNTLLTIDHRSDDELETFKASVNSYPISNFKIANDKDIKVNMTQALGKAELNGSLKNQKLKINITNLFQKTNFDIQTKSKSTEKILNRVFNNLPQLDIKSRATGSWDKLSWHIRSNLGKELEKALKGELKAQISSQKKKLKQSFDSKIGTQKKQLLAQLDKSTGGVASELASNESDLKGLQTGLKQQLKKLEKKEKDKLKKKAEKALKDLFK